MIDSLVTRLSTQPNSPTQSESRLRQFVDNIPNGTRITEESFSARHRAIVLVTAAFVPLLFAISRMSGVEPVTGAELPEIPMVHSLVGVGFIAVSLGIAVVPVIPDRIRSALSSFAFMTTASVLAYFSGGFIEAHFLYFVGVGVVALYEDWLPFGVAIGYVAAQHSIFGLLGHFAVYNHPAAVANPVTWGFIHAVFVSMLSVAILFQWQSLGNARTEITAQIEEVEAAKQEIEQQRQAAEQQRNQAEQQRERMEALKNDLEATAAEYETVISQCAEGDLTQRLDADVDSDPMAEIATSFNDMLDEWEQTVVDIQSFANNVSGSAEEVASSSAEIENAGEDVAQSVEEIAHRASEQNEQLQEVSGEVSDLSATVEEIASSSEEVSATARTAVERGETGRQYAAEATDEIEQIETQATEVAEQISLLNEKITEIEDVVEFISDISEQTNILALNASVEAARADEDGDGFSVVADEVKALAEEAGDATDEIAGQIEEVQTLSEASVDSITQMTERVEEGTETIAETINMFDEIADAIEEAENGMTEISSATDEQAASMEEMTAMVDEISTMSERTAADATDVSAATEEQAATLSESSQTVTELATLAGDLYEQLAAFKTSSVDTQPATFHASRQPTAADGGKEIS